jgi:5-formyltetrahydrofolate cyclo-ligase
MGDNEAARRLTRMADTVRKSTVRVRLLARRDALSMTERAQAAERVRAHLLARLAAHAARGASLLVAAYVPVGAEPGGADLPDALCAAGARVLLPVLRADNDLDWADFDHSTELVVTDRGLREPAGRRLGIAAVAEVDVVVAPAVAVDLLGTRLGRGAGCYDRALARVPAGVPVVALLHDGELLDRLPAEPHDRAVSAAVTPSGGWCDLPHIGVPLDDSPPMTHT